MKIIFEGEKIEECMKYAYEESKKWIQKNIIEKEAKIQKQDMKEENKEENPYEI